MCKLNLKLGQKKTFKRASFIISRDFRHNTLRENKYPTIFAVQTLQQEVSSFQGNGEIENKG